MCELSCWFFGNVPRMSLWFVVGIYQILQLDLKYFWFGLNDREHFDLNLFVYVNTYKASWIMLTSENLQQ